MAASPPPPPPPPLGQVQVSSQEVVLAVYLSLIGGALFLTAWAIVRGPLGYIYNKRTVSQ